EETLPVSLDVRQKNHFPSLAIALVIDRSGSMSGTKLQLALEAASATVDFLSERDAVTVIAFDDQAQSVVDLTKVENKSAIQQQIAGITIGGGTNIYPGLQMAYERLAASDAQIKHVIALSDGVSAPGDFPGIARAIRQAGMTLTSVAVGADADFSLMQMLANVGGGRFYAADEADSLPRIFTREAFLASASTIIEEPFVPRLVRPTQATAGIDWSAAPQLNGYVGTAERDAISSPAITSLISDKDDPVYAVWQYGLGRAAAFTSDAKPQWAANWMNWPGFGQFWTQMFRDTIRREGATDLAPRVEINAGKGRVVVEAISPEGSFLNNLRLRAHVVAPDFTATDVALEQTAAGRYEGEFPAVGRGAYLVNVSEEGGRTAPVTGAVNSYSPEFVITGGDAGLLAAISEATGGRVLDGQAAEDLNLFERRTAKTEPREIWQSLLLFALLLLPFDVGIRRLHITREQWAQARAWLAAKLRRPSTTEIEAETSPELAQLKVSRSRVRLTDAEAAPADLKPVQSREVSRPAMRDGGKRDDKPAAPPAAEPATPLASRLLDARRKKRE
ncbi:MAG TPA: VWA domain-containing protein, partial [Blastocatellia bacterium]|nr:VWA domain-containing protein [Blastocatellia bacterium]